MSVCRRPQRPRSAKEPRCPTPTITRAPASRLSGCSPGSPYSPPGSRSPRAAPRTQTPAPRPNDRGNTGRKSSSRRSRSACANTASTPKPRPARAVRGSPSRSRARAAAPTPARRRWKAPSTPARSTGRRRDKVNLSPQEKVQHEEAVLKFAKCMREHGVDVHASAASGGIQIRIHAGPGSRGPNPESPAFQSGAESLLRLPAVQGPGRAGPRYREGRLTRARPQGPGEAELASRLQRAHLDAAARRAGRPPAATTPGGRGDHRRRSRSPRSRSC